jgi:ABC-2 type transport system ATP-binding protein
MMNDSIVKMEHVNKNFHNFKALTDVSIELKQGRIYGLIGKNGAGKTTIMRILSGLSFPTSGKISLFGKEEKQFQSQLKRIGTLIEYPSLNGNMTAKENMHMIRLMRGIPNKELEDELLKLVGLENVDKKKVKNFSLGMRQRLGIAIAMIGKPELLILDEPVNGLDPIGVVEIRNLIHKMCDEYNMTILISSHNLPELYQTATDYIIIDQGQIKQSITLEELEKKCEDYLHISCSTPDHLAEILESKLDIHNYLVQPDHSIMVYEKYENLEELSKTLYENGIIPTRFTVEGETLEHYFITAIGGGIHA